MTAPIADQSAEQLPRPTRLSDVKGWFFTADQLLFDWFLAHQQDRSEPGDLLELGAYMGKSAIFLGARLRPDERFTVCDLFDSPAEDASNSKEMKKSYATLTRRAFEANYLAFHEELPTIIQGLSWFVGDHVDEGSVRFAHIDASHLYEHVHGDILTVRKLLTGHGVVVMDDYRAEHCPGVAAATWQAVANEGSAPHLHHRHQVLRDLGRSRAAPEGAGGVDHLARRHLARGAVRQRRPAGAAERQGRRGARPSGLPAQVRRPCPAAADGTGAEGLRGPPGRAPAGPLAQPRCAGSPWTCCRRSSPVRW